MYGVGDCKELPLLRNCVMCIAHSNPHFRGHSTVENVRITNKVVFFTWIFPQRIEKKVFAVFPLLMRGGICSVLDTVISTVAEQTYYTDKKE